MKKLLLTLLLSGCVFCTPETQSVPSTSEPTPPWKKPKYSGMQNISKLIFMPTMGTSYYVYEGNSEYDYMFNTTYPFHCGAMVFQGTEDDTRNAWREYRNITGQTFSDKYQRWVKLKPMNDTSGNVPTWMQVRDYGETTFIYANMSLVYSDYETCALLQYKDTDKCEVWRYANPDNQNKTTVCELLHEYVCPNNITVYYEPGCYKNLAKIWDNKANKAF